MKKSKWSSSFKKKRLIIYKLNWSVLKQVGVYSFYSVFAERMQFICIWAWYVVLWLAHHFNYKNSFWEGNFEFWSKKYHFKAFRVNCNHCINIRKITFDVWSWRFVLFWCFVVWIFNHYISCESAYLIQRWRSLHFRIIEISGIIWVAS